MKRIELPRPVEDYFAFAELAPGEKSRRFTITFSYFEGERLDRLQWWWQVGAAHERATGEMAVIAARKEAIERFRSHIETWLINSDRRLAGGEPFPFLERAAAAPAETADFESDSRPVSEAAAWGGSRVVNH
jgi:hypothetical protein